MPSLLRRVKNGHLRPGGRLRATLGALLIALTAGTPAAGAEKVTYAQPGAVGIWLAPHAFARQLGFFDEEGITFDLVLLKGSGEVLPQLVKGSVQVSMLTPDVLIASRQPGKPNFPVRFVYNVYRNSFWQIAVLDGSPIRTIKDLKGRTVGVGALTFSNVLQTRALLRREGIDPATVNFVAVGSGPAALESLRRGQIDALNHGASLTATLEAQGTAIRRLAFPAEYGQVSSHGLVFSEQTIRERPKLVEGFGRAFARGTVACRADIAACLNAYWTVHPDQRPTPFDAAARAREGRLLGVILDLMTAFPDGQPARYGAYSTADWTVPISALQQAGELPAGPPALDTLYTDRFVDGFNRFDLAATTARAHAAARSTP